MRKETFQYRLPVDTGRGNIRLRHIMDGETFCSVIHRIQNKSEGNRKHG